MDVSDLFARPNIPASALKRKGFEAPSSEALAKVAKTDSRPSPRSTGASAAPTPSASAKGKQRAVTIEDDREDSDEDDDAAGRSTGDFAPYNDADAYRDEDEDGRFFGGGLNTTQKVQPSAGPTAERRRS